jgi:Spy/CpxP family protein refolding chaperone
VDHMTKEFSLTDDQKQKILQINYSHMRDFITLDAKYKNDCVGAHEAHLQLMKKKVDEIKAVLNDEQKAKFDGFINKRKGVRRGEHRGHGDQPSEGLE